MGREEQREEREVLDSIFPEEITDISDAEYRVSIALDVTEHEEEDIEAEKPAIVLCVSYPPDYPDVAPNLDITTVPNAAKYDLLDVHADKSRLLDSLRPSVEENLGMAMIFTLVSTLKDSAEQLVSERKQAQRAVKEAERAKAEEEENRKFHGTAVTRATFLEWRSNFIRELEEQERRQQEERDAEDKKRRVFKEEKKMTGRQLWEKGLAGKIEEEEVEDTSVEISRLSVVDKT